MSDLDNNTYYGNLSKLSREFNKLDSKQITEAIKIATAQWEKDMRDISKVDLHYKNKEVPKVEVKKEEQENIVPFIRNNIESINQRNERASGGEER